MKETNYTNTKFTKETLKEVVITENFKLSAYFPNDDLVRAVEIARILQRPLLVRGEPGCGKTKLASAVAYAIHGDQFQDHFFEWHIKSTTKAKDGLYLFDHMARLRDVQDPTKTVEDDEEYLKMKAIGNAFENSTSDAPAVLLIDEIDKADIDFPNDLLLELDEKRFFIPEIQEDTGKRDTNDRKIFASKKVEAKYPPIVIITSNDEKQLPSAFLRRCVFHYIQFPKEEQLVDIAKAKAAEEEHPLSTDDIKKVVHKFYDLYTQMDQEAHTEKKPSTSELLDIITLFHHYRITLDPQSENYKNNELAFDENHPLEKHFANTLLKTYDDNKLILGKQSND